MTALTEHQQFLALRGRMSYRTKMLLGCSDYLPHLLVNYLDLHPYCFFCGIKLNYDTASIEHLLPISKHKGMLNKPKVLACYLCNNDKADRELVEYLTSERLVVEPAKTGFHFYRYFPQNNLEYIGMRPPSPIQLQRLEASEYGLLD